MRSEQAFHSIRPWILSVLVALVLAPLAGPARADERSEILFTQGLAAYRKGDLQTARRLFREASDADPKDANARLWLGIVDAKAGDDHASASAFDEAAAIDPKYPEVLLGRGIVRSRLGDNKAAREDWALAEKIGAGTQVERESARRLELPLGESGAERDWDLSASLGTEYDTNVFLFPNQGKSPLAAPANPNQPFLRSPRFAPDHIYDARMVYSIDGGYRFVNNDHWTLGTRHYFYAATQFRSEEVNIVEYQPELYLTYKSGRMSYGLDYTYTVFGLGGDLFMTGHEVEPSVTVSEGNRGFTRGYYRYTSANFQSPSTSSTDRDGFGHTVGVDQYVLLFERRGYARLGGEFSRAFTQGTEYDGNFFKLTAELLAPLPGNFFLRLLGEQRWGDYDNESVFRNPTSLTFFVPPFATRVVVPIHTGNKRESWTFGSATLSRQFGKHWLGSAKYSYTVNQSTADAFDYNRNIYSLFATYRF